MPSHRAGSSSRSLRLAASREATLRKEAKEVIPGSKAELAANLEVRKAAMEVSLAAATPLSKEVIPASRAGIPLSKEVIPRKEVSLAAGILLSREAILASKEVSQEDIPLSKEAIPRSREDIPLSRAARVHIRLSAAILSSLEATNCLAGLSLLRDPI